MTAFKDTIAEGLFLASAPLRPSVKRLADALRVVSATLASCDVPDDVAGRAAVVVDELARELAPWARTTRFPATPERGREMFLGHPAFGPYNPLAPPVVVVDAEASGVRAHARYGVASEGPPACAHGGALATALDAMLGAAAAVSGNGGVTRSLELRYRRPTPLDADVFYESSVNAVEGRNVVVVGRASVEGETTVEAKAVFSQPRQP